MDPNSSRISLDDGPSAIVEDGPSTIVEGKASDQSDAQLGGILAAFRRNPAAAPLMVLFGLLALMIDVPINLIILNLQAEFWGPHMAQIEASFGIAGLLLGTICAAPFGRVGDTLGQRVAVFIHACLLSLPIFALVVFGETARGLWACSAAGVLRGISGTTMTGAPCQYALVHEMTLPGDYETFVGMAYATISVLTIVGLCLAKWVDQQAGGVGVLWLCSAIFLVVVASLLCLRRPSGASQAKASQQRSVESAGKARADGETSIHSGTTTTVGSEADPQRCPWTASWRFTWANKLLLRTCIIAALVCVAEIVLMTVLPQYAYSCLGLLGDTSLSEERVAVAFDSSLAIHLSTALASCAVSVLSRRCSAFVLLKWTSLVSALLEVIPVLLRVVPRLWTLLLASVCMGTSMFVMPPLMAAVPLLSPPGCVGEAMGAIGTFKCMSYLAGNMFFVAGLPLIQNLGLEKPLWIVFPLCGLCALLAYPLALQLERTHRYTEKLQSHGAQS